MNALGGRGIWPGLRRRECEGRQTSELEGTEASPGPGQDVESGDEDISDEVVVSGSGVGYNSL